MYLIKYIQPLQSLEFFHIHSFSFRHVIFEFGRVQIQAANPSLQRRPLMEDFQIVNFAYKHDE